jgi:hypothetical protein
VKQGQQHHPEKVGVAFHTLALIEYKPEAPDPVFCIAKRYEGVVNEDQIGGGVQKEQHADKSNPCPGHGVGTVESRLTLRDVDGRVFEHSLFYENRFVRVEWCTKNETRQRMHS